MGPAARRRANKRHIKKSQEGGPRCRCSVSLATGGHHLPLCPRGDFTGRRFSTWEEVPNDVLTDELYELRNGYPPPRCPDCIKRSETKWGHSKHVGRFYEYQMNGDGCTLCRIHKKVSAEGYWGLVEKEGSE